MSKMLANEVIIILYVDLWSWKIMVNLQSRGGISSYRNCWFSLIISYRLATRWVYITSKYPIIG